MKKSLSAIVSLAMAFSMFSSVAFAATKTSADFSDLKDLDAATKAKFDALISAGIFDGVSEGTFGLKDKMNRAQFAKVAALIFDLEVNKDLKTSSFTDVKAEDPANGYALPYIEAVKKAGITDGYAPGEFNPAGEVTKEQLAAFLLRGLGKDADAKGKTGNDSTVSGWAQGYVALALELKLLSNGADGKFGGTSAATRDLLVVSSYEADKQYVPAGAVSVSEAKATGVQKVQVTFNKPVDTEKAQLSLKKGAIAVATTAKFADDKKSAELTLTEVKIGDGDYTVTLSGLAEGTVANATASFKGEAEKLTKLEFVNPNDTLPLSSKVLVKLKASNQYGENASINAGSYTVYAGNSNDVYLNLKKNEAGELILSLKTNLETSPGVYKYQAGTSIIPVNIYNNDNHVTATKNFKLGTQPFVTKVELGTIKYSNGKDSLNGTGETATFDLIKYDQYGNTIAYDPAVDTKENIRLNFNTYEPNLTYEVGDSNSDEVPDVKISLLNNVDKGGDYTFTVYNQAGTSTGTLKVNSVKVANKIEFADMDNVIAAGDTEAFIPLTAYDAAGNVLSVDDLTNDQNVARINLSTGASLQVSGENKGKVRVTNIPSAPKSVVSVTAFIASPNTSSTATKTYTVNEARYPERVAVATEPAKKALPGATSTFKFVVYDQYGKEYVSPKVWNGTSFVDGYIANGGTVTATLSNGVAAYRVNVTNSVYGTGLNAYVKKNALTPFAYSTAYETNVKDDLNKDHNFQAAATLTADASSEIKVVIQKSIDSKGTWTDISTPVTRKIEAASSTQDLTYTVNAVADLFNAQDSSTVTDYVYDVIGGVEQKLTVGAKVPGDLGQRDPLNSKFAREVTIKAIDAAGNVVAVPGIVKSIYSSNTSVANVAINSSNNKAYVIGYKTGTATLSLSFETNKGTTVQRTVDLNVKADVVSSAKIEARNKTFANVAATGNAFLAQDLKVTDNYGVTYETTVAQKYNYLLGVTYSVSNPRGIAGTPVGTVSIDKYGNYTITGNVTSFELVATTPTGLSASTTVTH